MAHLKNELMSLEDRYWLLASSPFYRYLTVMRKQQLPWKYMYFTRSSIDCELIRYMWNETDQLTLYGLVGCFIFGSATFTMETWRNFPFVKWLVNSHSGTRLRSVGDWHRSVLQESCPHARSSDSPSAKKADGRWRQFYRKLWSSVRTFRSRARYPFLVASLQGSPNIVV